MNCKVNERSALNLKVVNDLIKKNGVVPLKADYDASPEVKETLNKYGSNSIPFYLIIPGNDQARPITLDGLITKGDVLEALRQAGPSKAVAAASETTVRQTSLRD